MSVTPTVFNIARCSLHDGPGVRTVVYLKGCNMRCKWCHNPEGVDARPQLMLTESKCIGCGRCTDVCPQKTKNGSKIRDRIPNSCKGCGNCVNVCSAGAAEICGKDISAQNVFAEVRRDKHYYETSGGGVTISGGECLLYPEFTVLLLQLCKEDKIHTLVGSALYVPWKNVKTVLPYTDVFHIDLKHMDPAIHQKFTGVSNELILSNLQELGKHHNKIIVRVPVIPGVNDGIDNLIKTVRFANSVNGVTGMELLKYNNLAEKKHERTEIPYVRFSDAPQSDRWMEDMCYKLNRAVSKSGFVYYSR